MKMSAFGHDIHSFCCSVYSIFQYMHLDSLFSSRLSSSSNLWLNSLDCKLSRGSLQESSSPSVNELATFLMICWLKQLMSIGILTISEMCLAMNCVHSFIRLFITRKSAEISIGITVVGSSFGAQLLR